MTWKSISKQNSIQKWNFCCCQKFLRKKAQICLFPVACRPNLLCSASEISCGNKNQIFEKLKLKKLICTFIWFKRFFPHCHRNLSRLRSNICLLKIAGKGVFSVLLSNFVRISEVKNLALSWKVSRVVRKKSVESNESAKNFWKFQTFQKFDFCCHKKFLKHYIVNLAYKQLKIRRFACFHVEISNSNKSYIFG